jgi:two-component system OmpR family response regulator
MSNTRKQIFLVDDDAVFLKSLQLDFMNQTEYEITTFATGEECIKNLTPHPSVVVLDYHLDGVTPNAINGLQTLDHIKGINKHIPVVMLSSQDSIEIAINCMHHHAFDYVVKSETAFMRLQKIIANILYYQKMEVELDWYMSRM